MNPCIPEPTIYTLPRGWADMSDEDRFLRLRWFQLLCNSMGPTEIPYTTPEKWFAMTEREQQSALLWIEHEMANRRNHHFGQMDGMYGTVAGKERK